MTRFSFIINTKKSAFFVLLPGFKTLKSAFFVLLPGLNYKIEGPWLQKDIKHLKICIFRFIAWIKHLKSCIFRIIAWIKHLKISIFRSIA